MRVVLVGALNGVVAVGLGAIGTHLDGQLAVTDPEVFQTALYFQAIHAVLLVAVGALKAHVIDAFLVAAGWLLSFGVILFSGSLYLLAFGVPADMIGYTPPLGGILLLLGWLTVAVAAARKV